LLPFFIQIKTHEKILKSSRTWAWTFFECLWDKIAAGRSFLLSARDEKTSARFFALHLLPMRLNEALLKKKEMTWSRNLFAEDRSSETRALIVLFS
jgi:hypothetical protein